MTALSSIPGLAVTEELDTNMLILTWSSLLGAGGGRGLKLMAEWNQEPG